METCSIRKAVMEDIEAVYYIMQQVKITLEAPDWFVDDEWEGIRLRVRERGFILVAETDQKEIAAYFMVDFPGDSQENLGLGLSWDQEACKRVAHMDSVGVLPEFRGHHLQTRLLLEAEKQLQDLPYESFLCTIHPENRYSLNNMLEQGYGVVAMIRAYQNLPRYVLMKKKNSPPIPAILVSACLLGIHCRYHGGGEQKEALAQLMEQAVLVPICPEQLGGLPTPRDPAERMGDRVKTVFGMDVTDAYEAGATKAWNLAKRFDCHLAILKERSPSCGCGMIYDGTHTKTLIPGTGVTAELFQKHGIAVYGESKIEMVKDYMADHSNLWYTRST